MDSLNVIGTICAIISIPSSLYVLKQIWDDWTIKAPNRSEAVEYFRSTLLHADEGRVLLKFDEANFAINGTFENSVQEFANACPIEEERRHLIYNPNGVFASNDFMLRTQANYGIMSVIVIVTIWLIAFLFGVVFPTANAAARQWWEWIMPSFMLIVMTIALGALTALLRRSAERYRVVRDLAKMYMEYLDLHEIRIQREFTQSKRMHDLDKGCTNAVSPL